MPRRLHTAWWVGAILCAAPATVSSADAQQRAGSTAQFDILIKGGRVLDGTGNPWFYADIGIRGGRIVAVGLFADASAARTVDARGKVVVPGFIDLHNHADGAADPKGTLRDDDPKRRAAPNIVTQGVTTVAVNPDGDSPWPLAAQRAALEQKGTGLNVVLFVGHNTVRREVMGKDYRRAATDEEIRRMRALVRQGMEAGAFGLSAGFEYSWPGRWSTTDELVALVREITPFHGVYIPHQRSESVAPMWWKPSQGGPAQPTLLDAVQETIAIGEQTGAVVVGTHMKARGANYWGSSYAAIQLIERARSRGVEVYGDQYPYTTSGSDGNTLLIPDWATGSGETQTGQNAPSAKPSYAASLRRVLADPAQATKLQRDIAYEIEFRGGAENIVVFEYPDTAFVGKSLAGLAAARRESVVQMAIDLQLEGLPARPGGARLRSFSFSEMDVEAFARQPWMATTSDGGIALPEDGVEVHPRYYGTFPRKIQRYVLERQAISLEQAVRAGTALPAQILGLRDRGMIREGFVADVAVLDLARLHERATFVDPHQYSDGVDYVLVNGKFVVDNGRPTWALPGGVVTR